MRAIITGIGHYVPDKILSNRDLKKMGLDPNRVIININKYGNTTAATIPLAMSETYQNKKLKRGDWVVLAAFGAGFTWGSVLLRWAID